MRVIAVINQKGGVGKTTTVANVAHALALRGQHVVAVDLDPQGHLAACLGIHRPTTAGMAECLVHAKPLAGHIASARDGLGLIHAGTGLAGVENLEGGVERAYRLRDALHEADDLADTVLVDCPPSSGILAMNAIAAADDVLIPVSGDYLSLNGLAQFMRTLKKLEPLRASPLIKWVFFSRYVPARRLAREVYAKVAHHFPSHLLATSVREAAVLAECAGAGQTIFEYNNSSRSAREWASLTEDLINGGLATNGQEETSDVA